MTDQEISFDDGHAAAGPATCSRCETSLTEYWGVDGNVLCERCKDEVLAERSAPEGATGRVFKALGLGFGGMLVGATVWYLVGKFTGYEVGLIAILLGFLVGKGIFIGSGKRGGIGYQIMALLITYFGIGAGMAPMAFEQLSQGVEQTTDSLRAMDQGAAAPATQLSDSAIDAELARLDSSLATAKEADANALPTGAAVAIAVIALLALIFSLPVLSVMGGSIIGILIYGFALFEAFRLTRKIEPVVTGPHPVGAAAGG